MSNRRFCEQCRDFRTYTVTEVELSGTLEGKTYKYIGKKARCTTCGKLIWVPEINDSNLDALYEVYHRECDAKKEQAE